MRRPLQTSAPVSLCLAGGYQAVLGLDSIWIAVDRRVHLLLPADDAESEALIVLKESDGGLVRVDDPPAEIERILASVAKGLEAEPEEVRPVRIVLPAGEDGEPWPTELDGLLHAPLAVAAVTAISCLDERAVAASAEDTAEAARRALEAASLAALEGECLACASGGVCKVSPGEDSLVETVSGALGDFVLCLPEADECRPAYGEVAANAGRVIRELGRSVSVLDLGGPDPDTLFGALQHLENDLAAPAYAHIRLCQVQDQMWNVFDDPLLDQDCFGELLDDQREVCQQYLGFGSATYEEIALAAKQAGVRGSTIVHLSAGAPTLLCYAAEAAEDVVATLRQHGVRCIRLSRDAGMELVTSDEPIQEDEEDS